MTYALTLRRPVTLHPFTPSLGFTGLHCALHYWTLTFLRYFQYLLRRYGQASFSKAVFTKIVADFYEALLLVGDEVRGDT